MDDRRLLRFAALVFMLLLALGAACSGEGEDEEEDDDDEGRISPKVAVMTVNAGGADDLQLVI